MLAAPFWSWASFGWSLLNIGLVEVVMALGALKWSIRP